MDEMLGKTIVISGGSRGIGRSIALRCAKASANIVLLAKTKDPHPTLPGTLDSVAKEIEALGAKVLVFQLDVRNEALINDCLKAAVDHFGGIDILVNNASAISLTDTLGTSPKKFDLMMDVNVRGTFFCSQAAIPYLSKSTNPHILTLSPPISLRAKWFKDHLAYTLSKYGMSMCTLGLAEELRALGIAVNSLWPRTTIATAAIEVNFPKEIYQGSRKPEIVADAAFVIMNKDSKTTTGQFFIDEEVLLKEGVVDFEVYALNPGLPLFTDLFVSHE
jgi:citronellol/citronellal dehydrogenase